MELAPRMFSRPFRKKPTFVASSSDMVVWFSSIGFHQISRLPKRLIDKYLLIDNKNDLPTETVLEEDVDPFEYFTILPV